MRTAANIIRAILGAIVEQNKQTINYLKLGENYFNANISNAFFQVELGSRVYCLCTRKWKETLRMMDFDDRSSQEIDRWFIRPRPPQTECIYLLVTMAAKLRANRINISHAHTVRSVRSHGVFKTKKKLFLCIRWEVIERFKHRQRAKRSKSEKIAEFLPF